MNWPASSPASKAPEASIVPHTGHESDNLEIYPPTPSTPASKKPQNRTAFPPTWTIMEEVVFWDFWAIQAVISELGTSPTSGSHL